MNVASLLAVVLSLGASIAAGCASAAAGPAYDGFWASTQKDCRNPDSANRMSIEGGNRFAWYETSCRADEIKVDGARAWTMRLACEGEGEKFRSTPRLAITGEGRLVIENGPVGRAKRQAYVRCNGPKAR